MKGRSARPGLEDGSMRRALAMLLSLIASLALVPVAPPKPVAAPHASTRVPDANPEYDPFALLEASLRKAQALRGFRCLLEKRERLNGTLGPTELIDIAYREQPHAVLCVWKGEPAGRVNRALLVAGENDGQLIVRPASAALRFLAGNVVARDPNGDDARASSRVPLTRFGLRQSAERSLHGFRQARDRKALHAEYRGVRPVAELGGRPCHILVRRCDPPEDDNIGHIELGLDVISGLQLRTLYHTPQGELVGAYHFRDLELNPDWPADQFARSRVGP